MAAWWRSAIRKQLAQPLKAGIAFILARWVRRARTYKDAYKRGGEDDVARRSEALWVAVKRDEAVAETPGKVVIRAMLPGDETAVRERLGTFRDVGVTTICHLNGARYDARAVEAGHATSLCAVAAERCAAADIVGCGLVSGGGKGAEVDDVNDIDT